MTDTNPERRSNATHTWLIVLVVVLGLFAVSGVSIHHFGDGLVTIDGRSLHDLNPLEQAMAVVVGTIAAIVGLIVAVLATAFGLAMGLLGMMIGLLGAVLGIIVAVGVIAGPFIILGLIIWAIVKATSNGNNRTQPPAGGDDMTG